MVKVLVIAALLPGCLPEEDGTPPQITSVALDTATIAAETDVTVTGTVGFLDSEGDIVELHIRLIDTSGQGSFRTVVYDHNSLAGDEGVVHWSIANVHEPAGTYTLQLQLSDYYANDSGTATATLAVR
jgi:hypothetical protein